MATKQTQMAVVRIQHVGEFLLPINKALQFVDLMQHSVTVTSRYDGGYAMTYVVGESAHVEMSTVKASQIEFPPGTKPEPATAGKVPRIGRAPLLLR